MRWLLLVSMLGISSLFMVQACSSSGSVGGGKHDLGGTSGGGICPGHPENCAGTCCGTSCVDTTLDIHNCGGCNAACTGGTVCVASHCGCLPQGAPCSMSQTCCPNAGCADLTSDLRNCGACGHSCGDGSSCVGGICRCGTTTCMGSQVCCNGACADTCTSPMPTADLSMPGSLPLCDCSMLTDPLGSSNQCPFSSTCVANNCCAEDQTACSTIGCPPGTCNDPTPCQQSLTPQ